MRKGSSGVRRKLVLDLLRKRKEYLVFVVARILAVLVKPALLGVLIYAELGDSATRISLYYLALSSLMVIFNNEAHFYFYKARFSEKSSALTILREETKYYQGLALHGVVFSALVAGLSYVLIGTWWLALIVFLLIVLEKIFDEIQRFLQFDQQFLSWSKLMLFRQVVPFLCTVAVVFSGGDEIMTTATYFASLLLVFTFQAVRYTTSRQRSIVSSFLSGLDANDLKEYFIYYREKLVWNQLQSFSTRNVPLLDRFIVRFVEKEFLAVMSIISQMGSLCILFIDYFLIAHRRKEYLQKGRRIFAIAKPGMVLVFWALALSIFLLTIGGLYYFDRIAVVNDYTGELMVVGLYYSFYAISQHFVNFNFWNRIRGHTLGIDAAYYVLCAVVFLWGVSEEFSLLTRIAITLVIGHLVRMVLQVGLAWHEQLVKKSHL